ncbi:MAG: hypothetical protein JWN04_404 [Myxococcaceae bacterium]|nr:hypothetical protein [Myxococcaceae bacterium]
MGSRSCATAFSARSSFIRNARSGVMTRSAMYSSFRDNAAQLALRLSSRLAEVPRSCEVGRRLPLAWTSICSSAALGSRPPTSVARRSRRRFTLCRSSAGPIHSSRFTRWATPTCGVPNGRHRASADRPRAELLPRLRHLRWANAVWRVVSDRELGAGRVRTRTEIFDTPMRSRLAAQSCLSAEVATVIALFAVRTWFERGSQLRRPREAMTSPSVKTRVHNSRWRVSRCGVHRKPGTRSRPGTLYATAAASACSARSRR